MNKKLLSQYMAELGRITSDAKTAAAQTNGKLGGRPVEKNDQASILRRQKYAEKKNHKLVK